MRTFAYALVALSLGTIASGPAAAQCNGPECEGSRPAMPYYFTEGTPGSRGGFETPPPPQQQQRGPADESERHAAQPESAPPPRPQPAVRPPNSRPPGSPPRHRSATQHSGRPHYRVENPPSRYDGPRSEPPRYQGPSRYETSRSEPERYQGPSRYETSRSEPERYQGPSRYETSRSDPQRYQGPSRYETSRSEPPMRYDGTDRWPPNSSYSRGGSIPSAPDEVQRYSYRPGERGRITVNPSRDSYDVSPHQQYSTPQRGGGAGAGPGQVVISVEEYRALQSQARELQRLLGERGGGYRISRPAPGPYNGTPRTSYR